MSRWLLWAPLAGFALLFAVVASGLFRPVDPSVRSAMVGKPMPAFRLPPAIPTKPGLTSTDLSGAGPRLVNVFASWCVPCIAEAPQLMRLKAMGIPIDAIAIRDTGPAVQRFLRRYGDPYARIGDDRTSSVQLSLGSSGVPETFLVDKRGVVRRQYLGDIRPDQVEEIAAAVRAMR